MSVQFAPLNSLMIMETAPVEPTEVTAATVYFCVRFPSGYREYFVFTHDPDLPILLDHPFRHYSPRTVTVVEDTLSGGVTLEIDSLTWFLPFGNVLVGLPLSEVVYTAIVTALTNGVAGTVVDMSGVNFIASELLSYMQFLLDSTETDVIDLAPPVRPETAGAIEFVLISTLEGPQYKLDLSHAFPVPPVAPITVATLTWQERLFPVLSVPEYSFYYILDGDLAISFIHPQFCFLRQWIQFPPGWTDVLRTFVSTLLL